MSKSERWYCRVQGEIFGPLSLVQTLHYIILQRVGEDDEVSNDGENWQPLKEVNTLNPETVMGLKGILNDEDMSYLEHTLAWAKRYIVDPQEREDALDEYSEVRKRRAARKESKMGYIVIFVLIVVVVGISVMVPKGNIEIVPDCTSAPVPEVNWSNCRFEAAIFSNSDLHDAKLRNAFMNEANLQASNLSNADIAYANLNQSNLKGARLDGADLRGASLRRADLRRASLINSDLSFADLTGANLTGANLEGAKFSNTIWVDGKTCRQGSVGRCIKRSGK